MTINQFNHFPKALRESVETKAAKNNQTIEEYLDTSDTRFCVLLDNPYNPTAMWSGDDYFNYVVYDTRVAAEEDLDEEFPELVVSEEMIMVVLAGSAVMLGFEK